MPKREIVDIEVTIHHQTEHALLVSTDGNAAKAQWVPKSVAEIEKVGRKTVLAMPERMAIDKGLI